MVNGPLQKVECANPPNVAAHKQTESSLQPLVPLPGLPAFLSLSVRSLFLFFRVFIHERCHFISPFFLICAIRFSSSEKPVSQTLH